MIIKIKVTLILSVDTHEADQDVVKLVKDDVIARLDDYNINSIESEVTTP